MRYPFHLFVFLLGPALIKLRTLFACDAKKDVKRFIVVSGASEAKPLYLRVKAATKGNFVYRSTITVAAKRQICRDITSTYTLRRDRRDPYQRGLNATVRRVKKYSYPNRLIPTMIDQDVERVFVCFARVGRSNVRYYISKEYNLNAGTEQAAHHRAGRFIFRHISREWPSLFGLAELAALTFTSPDHSIESLYLQRRNEYSVALTAKRDALCGLPKDDLRRICVAVFNSEYFVGKVSLSNADDVSGNCELTSVSLQTEWGREQAGGRNFEQWMLSCEPLESEDEEKAPQCLPYCSKSPETREEREPFNYRLSHAYQHDEILVYRLDGDTGDVFLENLTVQVRLTLHS